MASAVMDGAEPLHFEGLGIVVVVGLDPVRSPASLAVLGDKAPGSDGLMDYGVDGTATVPADLFLGKEASEILARTPLPVGISGGVLGLVATVAGAELAAPAKGGRRLHEEGLPASALSRNVGDGPHWGLRCHVELFQLFPESLRKTGKKVEKAGK